MSYYESKEDKVIRLLESIRTTLESINATMKMFQAEYIDKPKMDRAMKS